MRPVAVSSWFNGCIVRILRVLGCCLRNSSACFLNSSLRTSFILTEGGLMRYIRLISGVSQRYLSSGQRKWKLLREIEYLMKKEKKRKTLFLREALLWHRMKFK